MINSIIKLTEIFFKSYFSFTNIRYTKLNIKGIIKWGIFFIVIFMALISYKIIDLLSDIKQEFVFLNVLFLIIAFLVILQTIVISINLFYSSKDMEYILPLPIKPIELLISKFNVLLISIYLSELLFIFVPMIIYGAATQASIMYYLYMIILLLIFPIFPAIISTLIIMLFMRIAKHFKNITRFQNVIAILSLILIFAITYIQFNSNNNQQPIIITDEITLNTVMETNIISEKIGSIFLTVKPSVSTLTSNNLGVALLNLTKVILITALAYLLFIIIGNKIYLKGIISNLNRVKVYKKGKKIKFKNYKKHNVALTYIKKEFKLIARNPVFFLQCILQAFYIPVLIIMLLFATYKSINTSIGDLIDWNMIFSTEIKLNFICIIIGIGQLANFMSVSAVTAFSRERKTCQHNKIYSYIIL